MKFYEEWIESHAAECFELGKPFVLEEVRVCITSFVHWGWPLRLILKVLIVLLQFGKKSSDRKSLPERHQLFSDVYSSYLSSLFNGSYAGNLRGEAQSVLGRCVAN